MYRDDGQVAAPGSLICAKRDLPGRSSLGHSKIKSIRELVRKPDMRGLVKFSRGTGEKKTSPQKGGHARRSVGNGGVMKDGGNF